jgi:hypothetical protein
VVGQVEPWSEEEVEWVVSKMEEVCGGSRFALPPDFFSKEHLRRVIMALDFTSSPGVPYLHTYSTLRDLFKWDGACLDERVVDWMWEEICAWRRGELEPNPIRVFIKEEPHKLEKIETGRLRLIASVAIREQLVDHMLMDSQDKLEAAHWDESPFKPGMKFVEGGLRHFVGRPGILACDKSSWDWTVSQALEVDLEFRRRMCLDQYTNPDAYAAWSDLMGRRFRELYGDPILQLSSGRSFRQQTYGLVKSGSVNTISTNSHLQLAYHLLAWERLWPGDEAPPIMCLGDDTAVEWPSWRGASEVKEYLEETRRLGCKIRYAEVCGSSYQFAGHVISTNRVVPEYVAKHSFLIPYYEDTALEASLDSLQRLYALDEVRLPIIHAWMVNICPKRIYSALKLKAWYWGTEQGGTKVPRSLPWLGLD